MEPTVYYVAQNYATGISEYRYFRQTQEIGQAAVLVVPKYPTTVRCGGLTLQWNQDMDRTVFPGCSTSIQKADTGTEFAAAIWDGAGKHLLRTPWGELQVFHQAGLFLFYKGGIHIASMGKMQHLFRSPLPLEADWEPRLVMMALHTLSDPLAMLMLSFPLFQIAP